MRQPIILTCGNIQLCGDATSELRELLEMTEDEASFTVQWDEAQPLYARQPSSMPLARAGAA